MHLRDLINETRTAQDIQDMMAMRQRGDSFAMIGAKYGISRQNVEQLLKRYSGPELDRLLTKSRVDPANEQIWQPVIDDDVPLPPPARGLGARLGSRYDPHVPLRQLNVGQSIFVPSAVCSSEKLAARINRMGAVYGIRFAVRKWTENNVTGTRVWRVEDTAQNTSRDQEP